MSNHRTNILICGVSRSGSQAVVDLLSEYENVGVFPGEFNDFRAPGMIADQLDERLNAHWPNLIDRRLNNEIRRNRSKILYRILTQPVFGQSFITRTLLKNEAVLKRYKKVNYRKSLLKLNEILKTELPVEDKIKATNDWVKQVGDINCLGQKHKDYFLMDQPVTPATSEKIWPEVFNPFKMICCIRDPKDQMANIVKDGFLYLPYGAPAMNWGGNIIEAIHGRTRRDTIRLFIRDIKIKYEIIKKRLKGLSQWQFLLLDFEHLVLNYQETKVQIEKFIPGIAGQHKFEGRYFKTELSQKNIGYYKDYLAKDEIVFLKELEDGYHELFELKKSLII